MFVLIWMILLLFVRRNDTDTSTSTLELTPCLHGFCIVLNQENVTAEAGLCVTIPCSLPNPESFNLVRDITWFKCRTSEEKCGDSESDIILSNMKTHPAFEGQKFQLELNSRQRKCSLVINDLTESDSGSYHVRLMFRPMRFPHDQNTLFSQATVSVRGLTQKPTVEVPPLTEGHEAALTCTAPGLCSGSDPEFTWIWSRGGMNYSHIPGSIIISMSERVTAVAQTHSSTLTFNPSAEHHGTSVTCRVSFANNITTEETVALSVISFPKILATSGCELQSDVLTCECVSEGFPLPTIQWPVLKNHSEYSVSTTASKHTVSSIVTFTVKDQTDSAACVSSNEAGKVQQNINITNSARREGHVFQCECPTAVVPWVIAAVALIVICILTVILWKKRAKPQTDQEERTYMSLQKTERSSEYDVIGQPMR
ncbi:uncharacterized protein V6R79_012834 [Siganus canaliculatus]